MVVVRFSVLYDKIRRGEKRQTIRPAEFYKHLKVGDTIHCYSTKEKEGVNRRVLDELLYEGVVTEIHVKPWQKIEENAKRDGFNSQDEMWRWFTRKYGFLIDKKFRVIRWR